MLRAGVIASVIVSLAIPAAAQDKAPPYWASISSGEAMMRTGPARTYPGIWLYKRRDLPVRVLKRHQSWRLIEDPDGTKGWMLVTMLSDRRTAMVKPGEPRAIRSQPSDGATLKYRAEPGVVGKIEQCSDGWCRFTVGKREGFIRTADLWGVAPNEGLD
jgi:SH3-like domain-containing protein